MYETGVLFLVEKIPPWTNQSDLIPEAKEGWTWLVLGWEKWPEAFFIFSKFVTIQKLRTKEDSVID
jgi:hypothetical protein